MLNTLDYIYLLPIFTFIVLIGGATAAYFIHPDKFHRTRTAVFISIMGSVAVVILSFNVILETIGLQTQVSLNKSQYTKQAIDKLWLLPNRVLAESRYARPEFLASFYYNNVDLYNLTKGKETPLSQQTSMEEQNISILLIQCWEDYLTLRNWDKTGDVVWINNFLQWAQSPYLKKAFDNLKYNYASTTIDFANLLFEYAQRIPVPCENPETYRNTTNSMLADPRLMAIYTTRENEY